MTTRNLIRDWGFGEYDTTAEDDCLSARLDKRPGFGKEQGGSAVPGQRKGSRSCPLGGGDGLGTRLLEEAQDRPGH